MNKTSNAKKLLSLYNSLSSHNISDKEIIRLLMRVFKSGFPKNDLLLATLATDFKTKDKINFIDLIEFIGLVHQKNKEKNKISKTDERKHYGIYYTNYSIANLITKKTLSLYKKGFNPFKMKLLEPCSGIGIFGIAYLDIILEKNKYTNKQMQKILSNMFFADIDAGAIHLLRKIVPSYLKVKYGYNVKIPKENLYIGDLLFRNEKGKIFKNSPRDIFKINEGFDIVLTNPPYKLLKANSNKYNPQDTSYKNYVEKILNFIRKKKIYRYNKGTLNLYKLFIEEIVENYTKSNGKVGILIPSTLLSDKQSYQLRKHIIENYTLSTIYLMPENNDFFIDICQAFCFFSIDKETNKQNIELKSGIFNIKDFSNESISIKKEWLSKISSLQEIIATTNKGWKILSKIHKNKRLKEITSIVNLRGELDLTLHKGFIISNKTDYPLLKGNSIKEYEFQENGEYVAHGFLEKLNGKREFLNSRRIVCQQISNIHTKKRLKFSSVPRGFVLANSCNFITIDNSCLFKEENITLDYLLGLLNSFLINWRFQQTSSNNHIGNYELDELPIKAPSSLQRKTIESIVKKLLKNPKRQDYKIKLNAMVFDLYDLDKNEAIFVLKEHKKRSLIRPIKKELQKINDL